MVIKKNLYVLNLKGLQNYLQKKLFRLISFLPNLQLNPGLTYRYDHLWNVKCVRCYISSFDLKIIWNKNYSDLIITFINHNILILIMLWNYLKQEVFDFGRQVWIDDVSGFDERHFGFDVWRWRGRRFRQSLIFLFLLLLR